MKPLENITLNGEPLINFVIRQEAQKAFKESSKKKMRSFCRTHHSFFKPEKRSEVKHIMIARSTALPKIVDFISKRETNFSLKDVAASTEMSRTGAKNYLDFLVKSCGLKCYLSGRTVMYEPKKLTCESIAQKWNEASSERKSKRRAQYAKRRKAKSQSTSKSVEQIHSHEHNLNKAILMHAQWSITQNPWHNEKDEIKKLFIRLAELDVDTEVFDIVSKIHDIIETEL